MLHKLKVETQIKPKIKILKRTKFSPAPTNWKVIHLSFDDFVFIEN